MNDVITCSVSDGIAVVKIDHPPVNAMDQSVRVGLKEAFSDLNSRSDIAAIVLGCQGRTFVAGADIKKFDTGIGPPGFYEVFRLIEEGIALRAGDIDVVYTSGYGFPRYRGGPMFYADMVGLEVIGERILAFRRTLDPQDWTPAPLLERLAASGSSFAQWDATR